MERDAFSFETFKDLGEYGANTFHTMCNKFDMALTRPLVTIEI